MTKCKIEYREPVFILELSASEKVALVECLKASLSEKQCSTIALRDLTNINTALREATDG